MKRKILLSLLLIVALFTFAGCKKGGSSSNTYKIKDVSLVFDQDSEFYDFKYKNVMGIEPDESKQAVYLDYKNNDVYNGRFVFRIGMLFTKENTLNAFLNSYNAVDKKVNGIKWKKVQIDGKVDGKDTTTVVYATEKNSTVYVVNCMAFKESNVDPNEVMAVFINGVTLKK